jgi:CheY-like chemotaxis protein
LGLTICKALVAAHEGSIVAHSEGKGAGSTFEFTLATIPTPASAPASAPAPRPASAPAQNESTIPKPAHDESRPTPASHLPPPPPLAASRTQSPAPARPAPSSRSRPLHIMLVEDHPDTATVMAKLLQRQGHDVAVAHTYQEAMALTEDEFDLAISDISLPDGSGLDLMRRVRQSHETTKGIALSGLASQADMQRSREAGFDQHLAKPINFDQLLTVINTLV